MFKPRAVYKSNAPPQLEVHRHVSSNVTRIIERLLGISAKPRPSDKTPPNPVMVSSSVKMGPKACTCDSMFHVMESLRDQILHDGGLFRDVQRHRSAVPRFTGTNRVEYDLVTWRALRSGTLRLKSEVSGGGTIFAVPKPSGGQREVWHGRYISSLARTPPKPRHQPTPACLLDLEADNSRPLYFSKRDAVSYFDSLTAPESMRRWPVLL